MGTGCENVINSNFNSSILNGRLNLVCGQNNGSFGTILGLSLIHI